MAAPPRGDEGAVPQRAGTSAFARYLPNTRVALTPKPTLASPANLAVRASVGLRALDKALAGQRGRTPAGAASAETAGPTRAVVVNRVAVKAEGKAANAHVAQPVPTAAKALAQPHVSTLADGRLDVGAHLPLLAGRYRYVCTLGSGATADVVACDDTFATPGARGSTVVIKVVIAVLPSGVRARPPCALLLLVFTDAGGSCGLGYGPCFW